MKKGNISLGASTPATLTIGGTLPRAAHEIIISNAGTASVYGLINWVTGDPEASATNFHFLVATAWSTRIGFPSGNSERIGTIRLFSTAAAVVGYISE